MSGSGILSAAEQADLLTSLSRQVEMLQAERDIRAVLAWYGFGADSGRHDEYANLFTEDSVIETMLYATDNLHEMDDHNAVVPTRFIGREGAKAYVDTPIHMSIEGRSQHHMQGPPAVIYVNGETATAETYSVVYAKAPGNSGPSVDFVSHGFIRWKFRKVDGKWKIAESIRRRLGTPAQQDLLGTYRMG